VNDALNDTELEPLLAQLLRLLSPAAAGQLGLADPTDGGGADEPQVTAASDVGDGHPGNAPGVSQAKDGRPPVGRSPADRPARPAGRRAPGIPVVSASEARALIELVAARGIAQGELGNLLGLEKSTVSRLAAGLERKGWIRRGRDEGNQRYVRLYLTREGGVIATQLWQAWQSRQERILASLSADERAGLSAGLRGLVRGLTAEGILGDARTPPAGERSGRSGQGQHGR
jgi:DNA-binding MarR family transcriptional regulator